MKKLLLAALLFVGTGVSAHARPGETPLETEIYDLYFETVQHLNVSGVKEHFCATAPSLWQQAIRTGVSTKLQMIPFIGLAGEFGCPLPKAKNA